MYSNNRVVRVRVRVCVCECELWPSAWVCVCARARAIAVARVYGGGVPDPVTLVTRRIRNRHRSPGDVATPCVLKSETPLGGGERRLRWLFLGTRPRPGPVVVLYRYTRARRWRRRTACDVPPAHTTPRAHLTHYVRLRRRRLWVTILYVRIRTQWRFYPLSITFVPPSPFLLVLRK